MSRNQIIAIVACIILSLSVYVGSTGWGYTIFRPLRYYDVFSLVAAWLGLAFYMFRNRVKS